MNGGEYMIIKNQKVEQKIGATNIKRFRELGYTNIKIGDTILININELSKGSRTIVDVECDYCFNIIKVKYQDYVKYNDNKYSCQKCRQRKTSENTLKERRKKMYTKALCFCNKNNYNLITPESDIFTADSRVIYECPKHGIHDTKIYTLMLEHKCINCANEEQHNLYRKKTDDVYNKFKQYGGILINKEDYISWSKKNLKVICNECKDIFTTSYYAFIKHQGQVCPKCSSVISKGEIKIKNYLIKNNIKFNMQFKFDDCRNKNPLPFDFYLYDYNICIEYDGEGHYLPINRCNTNNYNAEEVLKSIKKRDNMKTQYCKKNNIKLIRIPYWDFDNIENILNKNLFT